MPVPESCRRKYRYAETRDLALFNPRLKCLFQQNDRNLLVTPVIHVFTYWVGLFLSFFRLSRNLYFFENVSAMVIRFELNFIHSKSDTVAITNF